ncbi:MAG TPA: peptidylprolyl isomerase [Armatimonadota bacterium]|jgi:peptidyl-prolyl cis-trans isomerase B (cyclophilin B)
MKLNRILPALLALLGATTLATAAGLQFTPKDNLLTVENQWARCVVNVNRGGALTSYVWKPDNTEWVRGDADAGIFLDFVTRQSEILEQNDQRVRIRQWGEFPAGDPALASLRVERILTFSADTPAIKCEVTLSNPTAAEKRFDLSREHRFRPGGTEGGSWYYFRPNTHGLSCASWQQVDGKGTALGDEYVKDPGAGWTGVVNPTSGDGAVCLMDLKALAWFHNDLINGSLEYQFNQAKIPPAGKWQTTEWFVPTHGFAGFSYADATLLGHAAPEDNEIKVTLGAALQERADLQVQVDVFSYPANKSLATQKFTVDHLTFAPVTEKLTFDPAAANGFLVKVHVTGADVDSQFESFFAAKTTVPAPVVAAPPSTPFVIPADVKGSVVRISTNKGDILAETYDKDAPITAGSFLLLVKAGFYNGLSWHRVVPGFVIQGGDPAGNGSGGPGFSIPLEVKPALKHDRGVLSMARATDPNSAGSQFFICLGGAPGISFLDMQYAAFGRVLVGQDVVDKIVVGDKLLKVTVEKESPDEPAAEKAALAARVKE